MINKSATIVLTAVDGPDSEETHVIPMGSVDHFKIGTTSTQEGSVVDSIVISMKSGGLLELTPQADWRFKIISDNPRVAVVEGAILGFKEALIGVSPVGSEVAGK